jgi:hypothetical protein
VDVPGGSSCLSFNTRGRRGLTSATAGGATCATCVTSPPNCLLEGLKFLLRPLVIFFL